jgi:hypothetical protein
MYCGVYYVCTAAFVGVLWQHLVMGKLIDECGELLE